MNTKIALKTSLIVVLTALSLAACGSSGGGGSGSTTGASTGSTTGSTAGGTTTGGTTGGEVTGASHEQAQTSSVVASSGNISLSYPIYSVQTGATDANKTYAIEFLDYDPCYQGTAFGYSTSPAGDFNQLGFYFPAAPSAKTYNVGTAAGDIIAANGALGTGFTAAQDPNFPNDPNKLLCTGTYTGLASGTVTVKSVTGTVVAGTLNITLTDGSTITGDFTSGTCDATDASGAVIDPNGRSCDAQTGK
jgi:hypothetical protein